jgi:hypothetical protein
MRYTIFQKLRLKEIKNTYISLQLVDRFIKYSRGIVEVVLIKVDKLYFPVDFVILDMDDDADMPLILGLPFLNTGKTLIDVQKKGAYFTAGDEEFKFNIFNSMKHLPGNDSFCFFDVMNAVVQENFVHEISNDSMGLCLMEAATKDHGKDDIVEAVLRLEANEVFIPRGRFKFEELELKRDCPKPSIEEPPTDLELKKFPSNLKCVFLESDDRLPLIILHFLRGFKKRSCLES